MSQRDPNAPMGPLTWGGAANAPRIAQRDGQFYLQEHGNERLLQGQEIADGQRYAQNFQQQFPTGFQPDNPNSLNDAYREYTGREGDAAGLAAHQLNPGGFAGAVNAIRYSPEAGAYRQSQLQNAIVGVPQGSRTTNPGTGGPAADLYSATQKNITQPSVYTGYQPKYAMEGFNFEREQNTGKSAKDAFAYLANQAPPPPLEDKAALGQWFSKYIQPGMDQLGHKVSGVNGDTFSYGNHEGNFTVDFGRGAGAKGGALAWQAEAAGGSARPYTPQAQAPVMGVPRPGTSGTGFPEPYANQGPFYFPDGALPVSGGEPQQPNNMADYYDYLRQFLASQQESI